MAREGHLSQRAAQDRLRAQEKRSEEQRKDDLLYVMSSEQGRRFVADLIYNRCRWGGAYATNDSGIYRHEGRRAVAVELIAEFEVVCHDEYVLMVTERMDDQHEARAARDAAKDIGEDNG